MYELTFTVPGLLFSTLSILVLAYTSKFIAYGILIRKLYSDYKSSKEIETFVQILNLRKRLKVIQIMQICGITALFCCAFSMFFIYIKSLFLSQFLFVLALVLLSVSLVMLIFELIISANALDSLLNEMDSE